MFMRLTSSDPHQATNQKKIWDSLLPSMKQPSLDLQSQAILHWIWSLDIWPGLWPGLCSWRDADGGGFLGVCGNKIWWFHPWKKIIHVGSCNTHDIPTIVEDKCEVSNQIGITDYNGIYGIVISVYLYIIIYMCVNIIHTKQLDLFSSHSAGIRTRPLWPKAWNMHFWPQAWEWVAACRC